MAVQGTGYKGFSETDPSARIDKELTKTEGDEKNKQPASARMVALSLLPGVNPGAIGTGIDLLLPFHFLGSPQMVQNPASAQKQQEGTKKTDQKKEEEPSGGGIKITAGKPKGPEGSKTEKA